ncbi:MAG: hypothetical protein ACLTW9_13175 [Enterocloster sp.]
MSYHFFEHLLPEEREELISRFEENRCFGRGRLSIDTYLYYISRYSRIQVVRQIYENGIRFIPLGISPEDIQREKNQP